MPVGEHSDFEVLFVLRNANEILGITPYADLLVLERDKGSDGPAAVEFLVVTVDGRVPVYVDAVDVGIKLLPFHLAQVHRILLRQGRCPRAQYLQQALLFLDVLQSQELLRLALSPPSECY